MGLGVNKESLFSFLSDPRPIIALPCPQVSHGCYWDLTDVTLVCEDEFTQPLFANAEFPFIIFLQDRYGIGASSGGARSTADGNWFSPNWQLYFRYDKMFVVLRLHSGKVKVVWTGGYTSTSSFGFGLLLWVCCVFGSVLYILFIYFRLLFSIIRRRGAGWWGWS